MDEGGVAGVAELDRHLTLDDGVASEEDVPEAAATDAFDDLVLVDESGTVVDPEEAVRAAQALFGEEEPLDGVEQLQVAVAGLLQPSVQPFF